MAKRRAMAGWGFAVLVTSVVGCSTTATTLTGTPPNADDAGEPAADGGGQGGDAAGTPADGGGSRDSGAPRADSGANGTDAGATGADAGMGTGEPAAMQGMTAAHNAARDGVSPPAATPIPHLVWDETVAKTAQAWASGCVFQHSGGQYGENLFASGGTATPQDVVKSWVDEAANYDYATNSCSGVCGHYTQVVWAKSLRLGCGMANCTTGSPFGSGAWQLWVCNYDPPGNYVGEKPY